MMDSAELTDEVFERLADVLVERGFIAYADTRRTEEEG